MAESIMTHIGDDGTFTEGFSAAAKVAAGEGYGESKVFDDVPNMETLVKNYAMTKSAVGQKLENVIQKPGENATDEEKASYIKSLQKELGAPDSADDYDFTEPDDLPEALKYDPKVVAEFREFCFKKGIPLTVATDLINFQTEGRQRNHQAGLDAEKKAFEGMSETLKTEWKGDALVTNGRIAHNALMEFASNDLKALIKEAKLYDNAGDLELWNKLGLSPQQLRVWGEIGKRMKSTKQPANEGGPKSTEKEGIKKAVSKIYDHPSSAGLST